MTRSDWQFFMNHAGYATPPGRVVCAALLARAEVRAQEAGLTFEWVWDDDADLSLMTDREREKDHEVMGCVVHAPEGQVLASLWGVTDPDRNYIRVVEAELALEALAELDAFTREWKGFLHATSL